MLNDWQYVSSGMVPAPGEECLDAVRERFEITPLEFHRIQLQIRGIWVEDCYAGAEELDAVPREVHLDIYQQARMGQRAMPAKLPLVPEQHTPYSFVGGHLYYMGKRILRDSSIALVPLPERNRPRYMKGFSFPYLSSDTPFRELRLNPKNTGHCPGQCLFCQRPHSHRYRMTSVPELHSPREAVRGIIEKFGSDALKQTGRVMVITELFGSEERYLEYLAELKARLVCAGYNPEGEFGCCAQDIRTPDGLRRLYSLVNPKRYSFTLECFTRRSELMSRYKALAHDRVLEILHAAREAGFLELQINYLAGIDGLEDFENGITALRKANLINSIGFNIFTIYWPNQVPLRHQQGWTVAYYCRMVEHLHQQHVSFYEPRSYEMGYPWWLLVQGPS